MKQSRREEVDDDVSVGKKEEEAGYCSSSSISRLPEACLAHAISFTTPTDACRCSAVSADFQAAASSNAVWERFLPPDYHSILARADDPVDFTTSNKELFLSLAQDHVLLDQRSKSFWLERTSGAKCYLLSSRSLEIAWGDDARYWRWIYLPDSRFERVAALVFVCWFHLRGRINCRELSPNTRYIVYLIFKLADKSYGLDCRTQEAYITMDDQVVSAKRTVSLHPRTQETPLDMGRSEVGRAEETVSYPRERGDGWMEVQLGHFYNHQGDGMVVINLQEIVQLNSKKGLILEGMEIRHSIGP
ncbi:F-box protein PP2-B10 [Oryza sativa Japonica Group]|uniref:F-box domain containing protein, expressed n=2 Tax=Oryza sativa subsp. japonica TaxID=39947 RepID=Q2QY61_ORYSJ|nr:F-box protein PP2-B10 [Oryza sativa Japonica Group]KAB8116473.1 hypothetical protein EE612_057588 [Oryza sativa]ABA96399.2 F-box domain containing protein, expressed [Oryza sativa Japonica Group]EEE52714.1 hypothetical protein OsJ_35123 [Oryza sativa Japonica Group]KAF2906520.1 hypothetical protein DAI22_12g024100 [Oryza sativa Japonica Group]USI00766.1 F-box domain-containing protein [Oryza sativa Japonica Group]